MRVIVVGHEYRRSEPVIFAGAGCSASAGWHRTWHGSLASQAANLLENFEPAHAPNEQTALHHSGRNGL
jgi:hypothetical protein